jgi:citrate synthase
MPRYLSSTEAATQLGVSRQTLYAYVSRGLLAAHLPEGQRESRYLASDVAQLAGNRRRGRRPKELAKATLNWGLPVLESAITLIEDGQLFYRGVDAVQLARLQSVEDVAARLWQFPVAAAFTAVRPALPPAVAAARASFVGRRIEESLLPLVTLVGENSETAGWQPRPDRLAEGCGQLIRQFAACLLGSTPDTTPLHRQCAKAWGLTEADAAGDPADLIRMALILCADHELNASSFTARCIASTGASLHAAVIGGLAALTGGRHGGMTARVEALLDEIRWNDLDPASPVASRLAARLARGDDLPGFGHQLYPRGDVRAAALLAHILPHHPAWQEMIAAAFDLTGRYPSIDFALVALRRHLNLPSGAAFGLFALGRAAGWIAHALEQRADPHVIRPRAAYTGPAGDTRR